MKRVILFAGILAATATFALAQSDSHPEPVESSRLFENSSVLTQETGEGVYNAICAGCHMPDGEGAVGAGAYPALADNPRLQSPQYPIFITIHGQKAMPPLGEVLNDEQIAAVVEYIRTTFGNDYSEPVTADMVADAR